MGFWQSLLGTKTHCEGCGMVVPDAVAFRKNGQTYCGPTCCANVERLSSVPPPVAASKPFTGDSSRDRVMQADRESAP